MPQQPGNIGASVVISATRVKQYFVSRDGISCEVISAGIRFYLGNDALVRPGNYLDPLTGRNLQGYYIFASGSLTTAMIEGLKADSARWESEQCSQTLQTNQNVLAKSLERTQNTAQPSI